MPKMSKKIMKGTVGTASIAAGIAVVVALAPVAQATDEKPYEWRSVEPTVLTQSSSASPIMLTEREGISSAESYWALLSKTRQTHEGIAQDAFEELDGYLDDEQKAAVERAEQDVLSQDTFSGMSEKREDFEELLIAPREQKAADEEAEREYQEYLEALAESEYYSYYESAGDGYSYPSGDGVLTRAGGVNQYNGRTETWYSQRVLPGGGLDIPGRHVADDGTVRDGDGYIVVAASDIAQGTVVDTSLGEGKVYDSGCAEGTTDIYTDW